MTRTIEHFGIVENIRDFRISVRIVQTSACTTCSAKGYCSSADSKEKLIDVVEAEPYAYFIGQQVKIVGEASMGLKAVLLAFVFPFLLLVFSLFVCMYWLGNELYAALFSLIILIPYYIILSLNKERLKRRFSFTIKSEK